MRGKEKMDSITDSLSKRSLNNIATFIYQNVISLQLKHYSMSRREYGSSALLDYPQPHFPFIHSYTGFLTNYFSNVSNTAPY